MELDLSGRTALVCAASQGIGAASAVELAKLNANVIMVARSGDKLRGLVAELPGSGAHDYLALDLNDRPLLRQELTALLTKYKTIDIVINNNAGPAAGLISDASDDAFSQAFNNHLLVNQDIAQLVLPGMRAQQFGRIINITSTSVKAPIPNLGVSNTIRWAVTAWAKTLSQEVASDGITVNNVLPGFTQTTRLEKIIAGKVKQSGMSHDDVYQQMAQSVPAKRIGQAHEVAAAIAFLASPAASYINGIVLAVDGGRTACI